MGTSAKTNPLQHHAAKKICGVTIKRGIGGWIVCAITLGVGLFGGEALGDQAGRFAFGPPLDLNLPKLP